MRPARPASTIKIAIVASAPNERSAQASNTRSPPITTSAP